MLLSFDGKPEETYFGEISKDILTVGIISSDELKNHYTQLGITAREYICFDFGDSSFRSSVTVNSESFIFPVKVISSDAGDKSESQACLYLRKELALIVTGRDDDKSLFKAFSNAVEDLGADGASVEKFVSLFFGKLTDDDGRKNEETEKAINNLEENVIKNGRYANVNEQILMYNKKLMSLRNYYEQLVSIGERLYENENGIFDEDKTYYFKTISDRADRLCAEINLFRENLVRLREAYQARLDLKMNNTMKLLTVITVIFLPLTLITGWYGMNFINMPELTSPYGYPAVIGVSVAVAVICIVIFKKKKLL
ncbi:MAG: CorA family divalent cation transporter [Acutalibacteraceae bacterium]|nr:CorA family divalent cation transporter [Acutalibacteraceae bacterium]